MLDSVYADCHTLELIDPDPLLVVRGYDRIEDREIAALFCASIALGRASTIVASCRRALAPFGPHLFSSLSSIDFDRTLALLKGFRHRFFDAFDAAALLRAAVGLSSRFGGLEAAFDTGGAPSDPYPQAGVSSLLLARCDSFVGALRDEADIVSRPSVSYRPLARNLLAAPRDGSACKRLMLFLRWMVRSDSVDPGGWRLIDPSELVLPLDVHLHRISRSLGLTLRASADLRAALEVTERLRAVDEDDPVRFDFSLARLGIRSDYSLNGFYSA